MFCKALPVILVLICQIALANMKCNKCSGGVSRTHKGLKCILCENLYHEKCLSLPKDQFDIFHKSPNPIWLCDYCAPEIKSIKSRNDELISENNSLKRLNESLSSRLQIIETQMRTIKDEIISDILNDPRFDRQQTVASNENEQTPRDNRPNHNIRREIAEYISEEKNRESRKFNLCVHNLPEQSSGTSDIDEKAKITDFLSSKLEVPLPPESIVWVKRVGTARDYGRTMILKFESVQVRGVVLRNSKKLKDFRTNAGKKIFLMPDLTKKQQEENKKLNDELYSLRRAGKQVIINRGKIVDIGSTQSNPPTSQPQ